MGMELLEEISQTMQRGQTKKVKALVTQALEEGISAESILNDSLMAGMMLVGEKFKNNEVFVPEVLITARAMNGGVSVLEPYLVQMGTEPVGTAVVGTVKGDVHDIGKNLVVMMLKGAGFQVYDLGVDVEADQFIEKAEEVGADIIGMSALLSTTMPAMGEVIEELKKRNLRDKYIVMVGGAPVKSKFAEKIGADYYTKDAASCAQVAKEAMLRKK